MGNGLKDYFCILFESSCHNFVQNTEGFKQSFIIVGNSLMKLYIKIPMLGELAEV